MDELLAPHGELLGRLKLCYGCDRATFVADLLTPVRAYAAYVGSLPATPDNYFCEPGGLLRLGLEVGFVALQATDGHIVSGRSTISTRQQLEPRWRHATFLAGLCAEMHRTLSHVVVTDVQGEEWPAYLAPLSQWLADRGQARYFVRWPVNAQEFPALGLCALSQVVPSAVLQHLASGNNVVVPQLISTLSGSPLLREPNMMAEIVRRSAALVVDRDLIICASRSGRPVLGAHLERYVLDVMRRLVVSHQAWEPNGDRSRVWLGREGLFLVWPNAANEIRKVFEDDETPGMPKTPQEMQDVLLASSVVEPFALDQPLWTIAPPPGGQPLQALKLTTPEILLPVHAQGPRALTSPLVQAAPAPVAAAAAAATAQRTATAAASPGVSSTPASPGPRPGASTIQASNPQGSRPAGVSAAQPVSAIVPAAPAAPAVQPKAVAAPPQHSQAGAACPVAQASPAAPPAQPPCQAGAVAPEAVLATALDPQLWLPGIGPAPMQAPASDPVPAAASEPVPAGEPPPALPTAAAPAVPATQPPDAEPVAAGNSASAAPTPADTGALPAPLPPTPLALQAPMRLNRKVRDALALAVESLNGEPRAASAMTTPAGVFVPLSFLRAQRVEAPVALRELAENAMVSTRADGRAVTEKHEFAGEMELGIVLKPAFVKGFNPADFTAD
ncbi:MobH family relaxase [Azohydromonas aeria]|uniref:MobH family relaxase n=1 Tax=Azohydromonas aeria TaxID=2590212 RepID=UPI0012F86275|nr:MobH family relaxase [Azohydromonas aeria]